MRLTFQAKWVSLSFTLGPEADREDEALAYVGTNSADLSIAPACDETYYQEEEADLGGFGFSPVNKRRQV